MDNLIKKIIKSKTKCYFISPHFDDAVFSSGNLLSLLSGKVEIVVINIFTNAGDSHNTLSAKKYLNSCHIHDPNRLFEVREKEDSKALSLVKAKKINLGFTDALWRKTSTTGFIRNKLAKLLPEFDRRYPIYKYHIIKGNIHRDDIILKHEIAEKLLSHINIIDKNYLVFCPVGFGNHIDHLIVRDICTQLFPKSKTVFWSDFPYYQGNEKNLYIIDNHLKPLETAIFSENKKHLCEQYQSQIDQVIKDKNLINYCETFYVPNDQINKYKFFVNYSINHKIINEWKTLWRLSPNRNYFNSFKWYIASDKTFNYSKHLIITCYKESKMVGILPVIESKKFGIKALCFPGRQFLDKASILTLDNDPKIITGMINAISNYGNYYLSEIDSQNSNIIHQYIEKVKIKISSTGIHLRIKEDPYSSLSSRNRKWIEKLLDEYKGNITQIVKIGNISSYLNIFEKIESKSKKISEYKNAFADNLLTKLLKNLETISKNSILINILFLNKNPICYQYGFVTSNTCHWHQTAYDLNYKNISPGKTIMYQVLPELLKMGYNHIDFSRGESDYKKIFSPFLYRQYSIFYSPNKIIQYYWTFMNNIILWLGKHHHLFETIRIWKNRLSNLNIKNRITNFDKKSILINLLFLLIIISTLRGYFDIQDKNKVNSLKENQTYPFDLSPERGRFALLMSIVDNKSFNFSLPIAKFATPDLGYKNNQYVSMFAPAVSFIAIPGYVIGKYLNLSQVGAFSIISLFALLNCMLIRRISIILNASKNASLLASFIFLVATPAFTYATTLYQHHVSTLLILTSIYLLIKCKNIYSTFIIWFLFATSLSVDYPNLFLMLPIALFATLRLFDFEKVKLTINWKYLISFSGMILPVLFFLWFNWQSYGNPFQLSGTVPGVSAIDEFGKPTNPKNFEFENIDRFINPEIQKKSAINFFQTRSITNGLYILLISPDRGIISYTPIILLSIVGIMFFYRQKKPYQNLLISIISLNILLYSMWGDVWGGWAFGSRYLIPSYAIASIFLGIALTKLNRNILFLIPLFLTTVYSLAVNTLGALTSIANPPKVEVLALEKLSGTVQKYTFERNWDFLLSGQSKSFLFQIFFHQYITAVQYYYLILGIILIIFIYLFVSLIKQRNESNHQ
jgi:LmbE family N-acetylglucosaminyl deacetylase